MRALPCELPRVCPGSNCSCSATDRPRRAAAQAAAAPMRPPPMTATSTCSATLALRSLTPAYCPATSRVKHRPRYRPSMTFERDFVAEHRADLLVDLDQWLRIPSISAQPEHHADVSMSAEWLAAAAERTGFPTVEIWSAQGMPAVFAEWRSADRDAPTVLVYGHHDVQPVDPI